MSLGCASRRDLLCKEVMPLGQPNTGASTATVGFGPAPGCGKACGDEKPTRTVRLNNGLRRIDWRSPFFECASRAGGGLFCGERLPRVNPRCVRLPFVLSISCRAQGPDNAAMSPLAKKWKGYQMKPRIFIASSVEGKDVADALEIGLQHDGVCTAWHEAFPLSQNTIDTLLMRCAENDFAIFVFSPDDRVTIRSQKYNATRDNVLFESGLFMGMHGKSRAFIVMSHENPDFHMPSDLLGFTPATYDHERAKKDATGALGAAVAKIRLDIKRSLWAQRRLDIKASGGKLAPDDGTTTFRLKLNLTFVNPHGVAVAIESKGFAFAADLRPDPLKKLRPGEKHNFGFLIGRKNAKDLYVPTCILEPRQYVISWIPIDPAIPEKALEDKLDSQQAGTLSYRVIWLEDMPTARVFEDNI